MMARRLKVFEFKHRWEEPRKIKPCACCCCLRNKNYHLPQRWSEFLWLQHGYHSLSNYACGTPHCAIFSAKCCLRGCPSETDHTAVGPARQSAPTTQGSCPWDPVSLTPPVHLIYYAYLKCYCLANSKITANINLLKIWTQIQRTIAVTTTQVIAKESMIALRVTCRHSHIP